MARRRRPNDVQKPDFLIPCLSGSIASGHELHHYRFGCHRLKSSNQMSIIKSNRKRCLARGKIRVGPEEHLDHLFGTLSLYAGTLGSRIGRTVANWLSGHRSGLAFIGFCGDRRARRSSAYSCESCSLERFVFQAIRFGTAGSGRSGHLFCGV